jgi:hypothetical protein
VGRQNEAEEVHAVAQVQNIEIKQDSVYARVETDDETPE